MQERVRARGGRLRISSTPGAGTTVDVQIPLEA
jgi:signal transduction histidine kinase